jgi:hypothetical protein
MTQVLFNFFFSKVENASPKKKLHFTKTDLKNLKPNENIYVWMGHSSYFLQIEGKKILVDPVFSGSVSPLKITNKAFDGTDIYTANGEKKVCTRRYKQVIMFVVVYVCFSNNSEG